MSCKITGVRKTYLTRLNFPQHVKTYQIQTFLMEKSEKLDKKYQKKVKSSKKDEKKRNSINPYIDIYLYTG